MVDIQRSLPGPSSKRIRNTATKSLRHRSTRDPLVSVAMTSFNHAPFVRLAVESVLDQTFRDFELIVLDDGSSDGTPEIVAGIRDPRLKLIRVERNRAKHVRNYALRQSRGKYVAFQNSDDVWTPKKLEHQIQHLELNDDMSACFTSVEIINASGEADDSTWAKNLFQKHENWPRWLFDHGNCLCFPSAVVRIRDLRKVRLIRESLVQLPDYDLWVRLAAIGRFLILDEKLTQYRVVGYQNQSAPTESVRRRAALEHVEVLLRYVEPILLDRFESIFPELAPGAENNVLKQAALANHAANLRETRFRFLADRIWQRLFDRPQAREIIVRRFGAEVFHEFLSNRASLGLDAMSAAQALELRVARERAVELIDALASLESRILELEKEAAGSKAHAGKLEKLSSEQGAQISALYIVARDSSPALYGKAC